MNQPDGGVGVDEIGQIAHDLLQDAQTHNYRALAIAALTLLVWFLRAVAIRPAMTSWPKVGVILSWLKYSKLGHFTMLLLGGVAGGMITVLKTGDHITVNLVLSGLINGLIASGFVAAVKMFMAEQAGDVSPAVEAAKKLAKGAKVLLPIALAFSLAGCECFGPNAVNSTKCIVTHQVIDCTTGSVRGLVPKLLPLVQWLFSGAPGGQLDGDSILSALIASGAQVVGCTAAQLENDFSKPGAGPEYLAKAKVARDGFSKVRHLMGLPPGVRFKLPGPDGTVVYR